MMQTPNRETFQELVRRLATLDASDQVASADPLELMNEADHPTLNSIDDEDTPTDSSEWIRSLEVSSERSAPESGSLQDSHPAGSYDFEPLFSLVLRTVPILDAHSAGIVDMAQSGVDWQSTHFEVPEGTPGSGGNQTPAQDNDLTFKNASPSISQHEDIPWFASGLEPHTIEMHSTPSQEPNVDRTYTRHQHPVVQPGKSQILVPPGVSVGDNLDSLLRETRDARQVIDDLASRVTHLETAQFIRGRL